MKLKYSQWKFLRQQLLQDYPKSVMLIRWRMKKVLGFTDRKNGDDVILDFVNGEKESFFIIKYSEYFNGIN